MLTLIPIPGFHGTKKGAVYCFVQLGFLVLAVLIMLFLLYAPNFIIPTYTPEEYGAALAILMAYHQWYIILTAGMAVVISITAAGCIFCLVKIARGKLAKMALPVFIAVFVIGFASFLIYAMVYSEGVLPLVDETTEDIRQIEEGRLETLTAPLSPRILEDSMPGPYSSIVEPVIYMISFINPDTNQWERYKIPFALNFKPNKEKFFNDSLSIEKNNKQAQKYKISYTTNLKLIVGIEAVD